MTKTYKSNTCLSINVVMPKSRKSRRVSFNALSNGTSTFTTSDPELQKAIESHNYYGKMFRVAGVSNFVTVKESKKDDSASAGETVEAGATVGSGDADNADNAEADTGKTNVTVVKVADLTEAREYLANKFGVSRTTLRGTVKTLEYAKRHGIEFEGLKTE